MDVVLVTFTQLAVSIILAALATYLGIWLFERATRDVDEWKEIRQGNLAIGLTLGAVVVGLALMLRPAVAGGLPTISGRFAPDLASTVVPIYILLMILVRVLLALVIGVAAILFALWLFMRLTTELDELSELTKGNTAVAVMLSGVIIAIALLVSPVVGSIADWLVPTLLP